MKAQNIPPITALVVVLLTLLGCGGNGGPGPRDPQNPGNEVCVCPGLVGRAPLGCPTQPIDGKVAVEFDFCTAQNAVFTHQPAGIPVCRAEISSSATGTLNAIPAIVDIPIATAQDPVSHLFLNTVATLVTPQDQVVTLTARDLANQQLHHLLTVRVSNNCP